MDKEIKKGIPFLKKWWVWLILIGVVVVGGWFIFKPKNKEVNKSQVSVGEVVEELVLSGQVKAVEHANLTFQGSGELSWIGVKEGDWVKKGQILARLDTYSLYQAYESALADYRKYQASADKVLDDVKDHDKDETWTQRDTRTTAEVNRDKAYRALEVARKNLANANLKAPFAGLVTGVTNPFSGINTTSVVGQIEIVNPETMYFEVLADQTELSSIEVGQPVRILLDAFSEEELWGKVDQIAYTPKPGEAGTVYEVKVVFDKLSTEKTRVGMSGDASFEVEKKENVLYVLPEFVKSDKNGRYVKVNESGKKVYVNVGLEGEEAVEIIEGVKEGDWIYD